MNFIFFFSSQWYIETLGEIMVGGCAVLNAIRVGVFSRMKKKHCFPAMFPKMDKLLGNIVF